VKGVLTRCGVTVDLEWKDGKAVKATFGATRDTKFKLKYKDKEWPVELKKGRARTIDVF